MIESDWISELIRDIGTRIASRLDIAPDLVHTTGPPVVRRFSITQRFSTDATAKHKAKSLLAKTRRYASTSTFIDALKDPRTLLLAKQEYETHQRAFEIFSKHQSMSVPKLFELQEDLATIVMEVTPGDPLARCMSRFRPVKNLFSKQDLNTTFAQAGAWLRTFHLEITDQEPKIWKREAFEPLMSDHLETLRKDGISQRKYDKVSNAFERRIADIDEKTSLVFGTIHGDFKPSHVFVDGTQMTVIDFGTTRKEYGAADAGNFLADLACGAFGPHVIRRARLVQLASTFSHAYIETNASEAGVAVDLYCAMNLLRLWRKRRQRFPNGTPLRKADKFIDLSRSRGLLNRSYVDRWFAQRISGVLSADTP